MGQQLALTQLQQPDLQLRLPHLQMEQFPLMEQILFTAEPIKIFQSCQTMDTKLPMF